MSPVALLALGVVGVCHGGAVITGHKGHPPAPVAAPQALAASMALLCL